jgi:hypothetical protein
MISVLLLGVCSASLQLKYIMTNRDPKELCTDFDIVADIKNKKLGWMVRMDHGRVIKKYLRGNGGNKKNAKTQTEMAG